MWLDRLTNQNVACYAPFDMSSGGSKASNHALEEARQGRAEGRGEAALGNKRQNVDASKESTAKKLRRERWADQRQAANIYRRQAEQMGVSLKEIKGRGVTLCGWTQIANQGGSRLMLADPGDDGAARAFWTGIQKCTSGWVCPVCTHAKSEESRVSLNLGLAAARRLGLSPVMMTLTARHDKGMALRDFWAALSEAEQELKRSRPWKALNAKATKKRGPGPMRKGGFAKAVEVTHSEGAGWHPHPHVICLLDLPEDRAIAAMETLRDEWLHQLNRVGLDGSSAAARKHAFQVQGAAAAGNYVTKWGAAEEMTGQAKKEGKKESRTMWQLLRDARTGDTETKRVQAERLWFEAAQAMVGVHQLRMSPAFKALVEEERERAEVEVEKEEQAEAVQVWGCGLVRNDPTWEHVRWKRLRAIEAAEKAGLADARGAVLDVVTSARMDSDDLEYDPGSLIDDDAPP